jgi:hypothetical protein
MLDQEEYDGLEFLLYSTMVGDRKKELAEVDRLVEEQLVEARYDPSGWSARNAKNVRKKFGHRVVKFILNRHPAARGLTQEDKDLVRSIARGDSRAFGNEDGTVGITPENAKKWHDRINRILPVLKVIASFTPVPYNFGVIGVIVLLVIIDENRLKPYIVETAMGMFLAAA